MCRQIQTAYRQDWEALKSSGLLEELHADALLIKHDDLGPAAAIADGAVTVIQPEQIPFISYPYEWCFSELKDAALLTLEVQRRALKHKLTLKDASAYNVQFLRCKPILIDTLSFEQKEPGAPWIAYGQFCRHFLAPLALAALVDPRLMLLLRTNIDGIPLDLASKLLPGSSKFKPGLAVHLHMHGKASTKEQTGGVKKASLSENAELALLDSLRSTIEGLKYEPSGTVWADYYSETNYSDDSQAAKEKLVGDFISATGATGQCWDLGANTGRYSMVAVAKGFDVVAWDVDPAAVERGYRTHPEGVLPLVLDLTNPSPALGWAGEERESVAQRGPADVVLTLALIHHLAIGNNVPLSQISAYFAKLGRWVVLEFVAKEDSQVQRMLSSRKDVFTDYTIEGFEAAFAADFEFVRKEAITGTSRTLYLLRRKGD